MEFTQEADEELVVAAFPRQREAARMLRISEATLHRSDASAIPAGRRAKHYPPRAILEEGRRRKRRSLNAIAADLLRYAREHAPEAEDAVRDEIHDFFDHREQRRRPMQGDAFLVHAEQTLPADLYRQVRDAYQASGDEGFQLLSSDHPARKAGTTAS